MKLRLLAILLVLMAHEITAQPVFRPQKLDSLLSLLESKNKFMGSLSIRRNDQIMYQKAFGFSNMAGAEKAGTETAYRIGSISKTFTAIMVLQLVDEGKIKLCDKLEKYYPQVPNADKISLKQMLRHRSRLHNFTDSVYMTYYTQPKTRQEILSIISSYPIDFKPDSTMVYSNSNYVLLGYIIEDVTGKDYASNLRERITEPFGLQHTWFGKSAPDDLNNCRSYTYRDNEWVAEAETDLSIPHGAGAILSTPEDLTILGNALFKNQLLSEVAFTEMKRLTDNFGCGMFILPFYDRKAYGHNGSIDGFGSIWAHFPPDSVTVAMCCNGINYNMNDILIGVLSIYFDKPYTLPNFDVAQVDAKKLTDYEGTYSSLELPLKLNIFVKDGSLYGQGTGQSSFQLDAINDSTFRFDPAGLRIQFSEFSLKLNQNGKEFTMDKIY